MAAPHVAGAAALLLAVDSSLSVDSLKFLIMDNVDPLLAQWGTLVVSRGRLNVWRAAEAVSPNQSPMVTLTSPGSGATFTAPATIGLAATASDPDGTVSSVEFRANGSLLNTDTKGPNFTFNWTNVPAGGYSLTAVATDNLGRTTTSTPVTITVTGSGGGTSAAFVGMDTSRQGSWIGAYGTEGHAIVADATSLPAYATVAPVSQSDYVWNASTADVRALQRAAGGGRLAATWYSPTSFDINVNLTDAAVHQVALYMIDWDGAGRQQRVDVVDAVTGGILDTRTVSGFQMGGT